MGIKKKSPFITSLKVPTNGQPNDLNYVTDLGKIDKLISDHYRAQY